MKLYKEITLVLLTFLVSMSTVYSQDDNLLTNYIEVALKNNPTVQQKYAEYEASLQLIPQVGSLPDPEFSAGIFLKPMEILGGSQVADLRLMQMFPWFGTLKYAKDEMSLMAKAKFETFRDAKFQVIYEVQQSWYELYKIQQGIEISQKNLDILNTLERLSLIKFKTASISGVSSSSSNAMSNNATSASINSNVGMSGMGGNTTSNSSTSNANSSMQRSGMQPSSSSGLADLYRIQIEISDLENNIALLNTQKRTLTAQFNSLLNRDSEMKIEIPNTLQQHSLKTPIKTVVDSMLVQNPMLGMLNFEKQSLDARKEMVTRMGYPMVGLGVNYAVNKKNPMSTLEMNGEDMIMPMITLSLPIFRKKYKAMQTEVEKIKSATEFQYQATANNLKTEYYETLQNYEDAKRRIDLYAKQYGLANQSLNIMIKSYSASGVGLTDLLIIQQQTLDYELKQVQSLADYNAAIAKLNRLMAYSQLQ